VPHLNNPKDTLTISYTNYNINCKPTKQYTCIVISLLGCRGYGIPRLV